MKHFKQNWREKLVYLFSMLLSKSINSNKDIHAIDPKHILCIRQDEIGDMCYTLHVFEMLKKQFPHSKVTLLCKPFAITLLNNNPYINHLTSNYSDLIHSYDVIIDLRGSWRSLLFAVTHWPTYRFDRATVRYHNSSAEKHPHEVLTNLQIIAPIIAVKNQSIQPQIFTSTLDIKKATTYLLDHAIEAFAILHIGARKTLRKWDKYVDLAIYLKKEKGLSIIFTGDSSEVMEIKMIQQQLGFETFSIAGLFNLTELAAVCSKASLYVGNESGPLHIAALSGSPSLGLYGPGEPFVFYPWGNKTQVIHPILECNPCDQIHCVHPENPCINRIELMQVITKVENLLA